MTAVVEFHPYGEKLPHDPQGQREHERDLVEVAERAHQADEAARASHPRRDRRRWWSFWKRSPR